jgi:phosphopantothenoylcysteine decarboxylase/phosphopantothenate--cysteine ligase
MNAAMWEKPSVQRNIETLRKDGYQFLDPQTGWQSCRRTGMGRMAEPHDIQAAIESLLTQRTEVRGQRSGKSRE